jgi:hypothetical protein
MSEGQGLRDLSRILGPKREELTGKTYKTA